MNPGTPGTPGAAPVEFSRVYRVDDLPPGGSTVTLTADDAECAALARRFGLLALRGLTVRARISPRPVARGVGRSVRIEGEFEAEVEQECVVTLEPVSNRVADRFALVFADQVEPAEPDLSMEAEADEEAEPLVDGSFDLGEAAAELVALAIDPYPRAPNAVFEAPAELAEQRESPFAVLRRLSAKS
jgi:uncharacterized metal-binding protein YceD (DUF177 family)